MVRTYYCNHCKTNIENLIEYCTHINAHNIDYIHFDISPSILLYMMAHNIEPEQDLLDNEISDDGDIIYHAISKINNEIIALDLLNLIDPSRVICTYEIDDPDKLKNYLLSIGVITNITDDLDSVSSSIDYTTWENYCHWTNNSLLMECIKKGWVQFCIRLLDFDVLYDINKQNITNAYEMALTNNFNNVSDKIKIKQSL